MEIQGTLLGIPATWSFRVRGVKAWDPRNLQSRAHWPTTSSLLGRNAESQALPQTCWNRICILTKSPSDWQTLKFEEQWFVIHPSFMQPMWLRLHWSHPQLQLVWWVYPIGSLSVVPRLTPLASFGNLLEMYNRNVNSQAPLETTESEILGLRPCNLYFNRPS